MNSTAKQVDWEDLELPPVVYKYRCWDNDFHKTIITQFQVFMSPPTGFEDKKDCKNLIRYDLLSDEQIWEWYFRSSNEQNPNFSEGEHRAFADQWLEKSPLKDPDTIRKIQEQDFLEYDTRIGILSLTADPLNSAMWEKYSNNYKGFCVGFDPIVMFKFLGGGGIVEYDDELPIVLPTPLDSYVVQHFKQVFFKEKKWEFEKEYRTTKFNDTPFSNDQRTIVLPVKAYKEVVFGKDCPNEYRDEIVAIVQNTMPHVTFHETFLDDNGVLQRSKL